MSKYNEMAYWIALAEKYFDAATTEQEEKKLAAFLATDESNTPEFNEIKAVMGYIATARKAGNSNIEQKRHGSKALIRRWFATASVAAAIAVTAIIGFSYTAGEDVKNEVYIANIDGKIYTDKEFVLAHMQQTIAMIGNITRGNDIEEQLGAMFSAAEEYSTKGVKY